MTNIQTSPPKQLLLRLPDDVARKLASTVAPRQRNKFLVELLRRELAKEDAELVASCEYMNALEKQYPEMAKETEEWVNARMTEGEDDDFDRQVFEREFAIAQAAMLVSESDKKHRP